MKSTPSRARKADGAKPAAVPAAVIGLGLMGMSIIACLLSAGHSVLGLTRDLSRHRNARRRVRSLLGQLRDEGILKAEPDRLLQQLTLSEDFSDLSDRLLVIESIIEDLETKREYIRRVEEVVSSAALIGSNTSSIPVSELQRGARHPERILGIHWGEPAHVMRFLEIICGERTEPANAERVRALARYWRKEPTMVRRDIRGFITNRIMYAMLREAFYLVENGYASIEDVDRSVRNDMGWWLTLAGPFRYMDLTGIPAYQAVMEGLLPELCSSGDVPYLMRRVVESGGRFYKYTPAEARRWEKKFLEFTYDVRKLAMKYQG